MSANRSGLEDVDELRIRSRQQYLQKREAERLALLRTQVAEEAEEERTHGAQLSRRELEQFARNRATLEIAEQRLAISDGLDGYVLPDSEFSEKSEVLNRKTKDKYISEVDQWEQEVSSRAKAAQFQKPVREQQEDYEYVFDVSQGVQFDTDIKLKDLETARLEAQLDAAEKRAKSIDEVRKSLPVYAYKEQLESAISEHPVLILVSETGSGKTTQVPQFAWELMSKNGDTRIIGCTQPRRVAAMSVAQRVAEEVGTKLGHTVGYSVRFDDRCSEKTKIKYMTDGMLLRELMGNPSLDNYSCIMLDEAHERSLATDLLFPLVKDIQKATGLKLIISSATLDAQKFSTYFDDAPIFNIPGRTYDVQVSYAKQPEANYLSAIVTTVWQIHLTQPPGDILAFLPGADEIEAGIQSIEETARKLTKAPELIALPLYSSLSSELQARVFEPTPAGSRKVILSTNIAETSVTISQVRYVCDSGYEKQNVYNSKTGMSSLVVTPISRASAAQRAGRAGRTGPGVALRMYSKWAFYNELPESTPPEIQRVPLAPTVLLLKSLNINDLINFDFLDPPSPDALIESLSDLYSLQALTAQGELSSVGRRMSEFPLDPMLSRAILEADKLGAVHEILIIVSMASDGNGTLFIRPKDKKLHADAARNRFIDKEGGDVLLLLKVFQAFEESGWDMLWTKENFLDYRTLTRARDVRDQLVKICERVSVDPSSSCGADHIAIRKALTAGYFRNTGRLMRDGASYRTLRNGMTVYIHPSSALLEQRPKLICFLELVMTSKEWARTCFPIEDTWLTTYAPHYFKKGEIEGLGVGKKMPKENAKMSAGVSR